jgi:AcrR family transcriptional regulator
MAEIAKDLGMSTANLYRYFPSKIDIAETFALRCFEEKEDRLDKIVKQSDLSAEEQLSAFVLELLQYNYQQLHEYPTINEFVNTLCETKSILVDRKREGESALLSKVLARGVEQAAWQCEDIEQTSKTIMASWVLFSTPVFMRTLDIKQLEDLARNNVHLLLNGLKERKQA